MTCVMRPTLLAVVVTILRFVVLQLDRFSPKSKVQGPKSVSTSDFGPWTWDSGLSLECFHPADDFHDLAGDLRLAGPVVRHRELLDHVRSVLGGALHGHHAGDLLADGGVQERLEQLHLEARRHDLLENALGTRQ